MRRVQFWYIALPIVAHANTYADSKNRSVADVPPESASYRTEPVQHRERHRSAEMEIHHWRFGIIFAGGGY